MDARKLLFLQLTVALGLLIFHYVATVNFLYWRFHGIDIPAHILGGIWAGLFASWLLINQQKPPRLVFCIAVTLILAIMWEIFETETGQIHFPADAFDTVKDFVMGVIGSVIGFFIAKGNRSA